MSAPARTARTAAPPLLRLGGAVALPVRPRPALLGLALLAGLAVASVLTLTVGRLGIPLAELPAALAGTADPQAAFVLERLRGPRLAVAVGAGFALGTAGALFQSVARNPLGSPDVIGVGAGAGAGAALFGLLLPGILPGPAGAVLGGAAAALLVYLATGTGFRDPGKLIIAGIGVAAMSTAFTHYVVYVVARDRASVLQAYLNGSLSARSWEHALTIGVALALLLPCAAALSTRMAIAEMGDDIADGLGARPRATRAWAVALSVALSAAAVAVAGPIAFIALTAPNIAKRLSGGHGAHAFTGGLTGALLLVLADIAAQHSPIGDRLPVGVFTMGIGGVYLGYLLVREWRKGAL
ncbi:FecCD family ABC transporter permease [Allonocardiopsis opalescens]|uniref:Iron complex transport system permease protein n=1 Tax=Allonocardiopsis opalescens TaxID=1144618 RepID=A0A2T0QEN6_9ACTN|nr:iron chelate uptake ABC transporter family permease subunit [Allonocardiopsis opalescens]PRY02313.1 iron complex transport system permease protein [Allonocardiopsis opalescens]